jgi:serine/threonine-protein kinase
MRPNEASLQSRLVNPPNAAPVDGPPRDWQSLADDSAPVPLDLLPAPNQTEPTIGHVGRYALKHRLGEGGLGRVYTAWDPILSRNLAIKTLQLGASGVHREALDALILNEARAVASLNHPNIVTIYDAGLSELGVYIAMEQLPGSDLRQLLNEGWRPDALRAARLMRRVADALSYAHGKGVIHCDIKPANILLIDRRKPKVLDFGIARVAHRTGDSALDGLITGSPHYLAPEQMRGDKPDERTDVYAMGVVLYELLTGRKAFSGRSIQDIADAVLQGQPVPARALAPGVPQALSAITAKAMAVAPEDRFASARELSAALRQWLGTATAPAEPAPVAVDVADDMPPQAEAPTALRRALPLLAAGGLAVLAAVVLWLRMH